MPAEIIFLTLVFGLSILLVVLMYKSVKKGISGLKLMLLAINITLVGGIIAIDSHSSLGGFEYLL
ncbi:hypothetical protein [Anaerobacillus sp. CMMVII]|uniref:hypothetical protein n=1 Tax=Anaerobacillus sp. CMMVII TaxID=2755588 RepID=UPI0021B764A6|nr:hypothetical protein [Anaerobacillus sp. CMMVII]